MGPDAEGTGVVFGAQADAPRNGGNAAQRREHDKRIGAGTMSRTGAECPLCRAIVTMEDIRYEGRAGRLGAVMTAVVVDGPKGKEYRLPTDHEREAANVTEEQLQSLYADIPFGLPEEPLPSKEALGFRVPLYGFDTWRKLFTNRQLLALGEFVLAVRGLMQELERPARCLAGSHYHKPRPCDRPPCRLLPARFARGTTAEKRLGIHFLDSRFQSSGTTPRSISCQIPLETSSARLNGYPALLVMSYSPPNPQIQLKC